MMISMQEHKFEENLNGYYDVGRQLPDYLLRMAEDYVRKEKKEKEQFETTAQFETRRDALKKVFMKSIGGIPTQKTPLNPVITKTVVLDKYQVKNVVFESLPKLYVTANLYIPNGLNKPTPAVLMACGHSDNGKAADAYQRVAIDLAMNGMIVLVVDPVGQGERLEYDRLDENGNYLVGRTTREHTHVGQQCILTGSNLARYMVWDLIRAVDYLESLEEVDASRIGMTGNSGGGTQTSYMMMCEERLAAAMPCCFISSRLDYMKTGQVQDAEQIVYDVIRKGINHDDFITALAPKPVRIGAARYDFFCAEGADKTLTEATKIYALYEKEGYDVKDALSISYASATHGFSTELRQGAVNFFRRTLLGLEEDFVADPDLEVLKEEMLWATKSGRVIQDYPDYKTTWQYNLEHLDEIHYTDTNDKEDLKNRVLSVLNISEKISDRFQIKFPRIISDQTDNGVRVRKIFFFTEENIVCAGVLFEKTDRVNDSCSIYVSNESTTEMSENQKDIMHLLDKGAVFVFDPRGTGSVKFRKVYPYIAETALGRMFDTYYKLNCDSQMMGTSLYAQRVYDILRAEDLMREFFGFEKVVLAGREYGAVDVLTSAALQEDAQVMVFGATISFEEIVRDRYYHPDPRNNIYGILEKYDVGLLKRVLNVVEIADEKTLA